MHRTTAMGETVGGEKGPGGGGGNQKNELLTAGLITLGAAYGGTLIGAIITEEAVFSDFDRSIGAEVATGRLRFPILGPYSALIYNEDTVRTNCNAVSSGPVQAGDCDMVDLGTLMILVAATTQTAGVVMTVYALLHPDKGGSSRSKVALVPRGSSESAGVTLIGAF